MGEAAPDDRLSSIDFAPRFARVIRLPIFIVQYGSENNQEPWSAIVAESDRRRRGKRGSGSRMTDIASRAGRPG
ncbi:hypothetical protein GCM10009839_22290 [Catenulispora yoronensis]|uniref:Uncharacterized protein n=1 Tax=Catenulispora yoronensis TaxID=450799 RepID=A0ABP5FCV7_9ACTN